MAKSDIAKKLFPRENLIASSKHLPNFGEMLSPTIQPQGRSKGDNQPWPPTNYILPPRGGGRQGNGKGGGWGRGGNRDRGTRRSQPEHPSSRQGTTQFTTVSGGPPTLPYTLPNEEEEGLARRTNGGEWRRRLLDMEFVTDARILSVYLFTFVG